MASDKIGDLIEQAKAKNFQALARLLSELERKGPGLLCHPELLSPPQPSFRIGITGPPGAGKSTLIGQLIQNLQSQGLNLGILAVDPSSPFTRGAILGDRIRYADFIKDDQVFVRSVGSRGSLGGLSASAYLMLRAFDLAGFDLVLIETVGVGQTELEVMHVADFVSVVLVPESGDSVQAMKAGLLEIADHFVVNKCDRPGADAIERELKFLAETTSGKNLEVSRTVATDGTGLEELTQFFLKQAKAGPQKRQSSERLKWEAQALLRSRYEAEILAKSEAVTQPQDLVELFK